MTRLISAVFRHDPAPKFLVEELKSIYDPNGGYFSEGAYIPSLAAAIGKVIERHLSKLGIIEPKKPVAELDHGHKDSHAEVDDKHLMICPHCNEKKLTMQENCMKCLACGYSKCG